MEYAQFIIYFQGNMTKLSGLIPQDYEVYDVESKSAPLSVSTKGGQVAF